LAALLGGEGTPSGERARALAILRVAARSLKVMRTHGLGRASLRFASAAEALERNPQQALPARAVLVHGFADATGGATRLIEALLRNQAAQIILDHPPDPCAAGRPDAGTAFTDRFRGNLALIAPITEAPAEPPAAGEPAVRIDLLNAPGAHVETRAVGLRVRKLLDDQARPEGIALVSRQIDGYRVPIRTHFSRLGIPFSGLGAAGSPGPVEHRARALLAVLERRADAPVDRWLDTAGPRVLAGASGESALPSLTDARRGDLRLALHAQGVARVADAAELDLEALSLEGSSVPLPVRRGLALGNDTEDGEPARFAPRRTLSTAILRAAARSAASLCKALEAWPEHAPLTDHFAWLKGLLAETLRFGGADDDAGARLLERIDEQAGSLPRAFPASREDFALLLRLEFERAPAEPVGGEGAGVQLLTVVEARARTFDHLFLLGMNRDVFPRIVLEDPLLPDRLRSEMLALLPSLPIKARGFDEERYLFATLLSAAQAATLSWERVTDEGKARTPSPFVERLRWADPDLPLVEAPSLQALVPPEEPRVARPAHEHALLAGLHGGRARFKGAFVEAVKAAAAENGEAPLPVDPGALATARLAVLAELDPPYGSPARASLGPYHGFVGARIAKTDFRVETPYVTNVEQLALCPWQALLTEILRIESPPDAPGAIPEIDILLVGKVVHGALERITRPALGEARADLAAAIARGPVSVAWPEAGALEEILLAAAREALLAEGIGHAGLAPILAARARGYVERAGALDWTDGALQVLGAEISGKAVVADRLGRSRTLGFRADRVDLAGGRIRLTDYKTGKPFIKTKKEATQRRDFLAAIRRGKSLQAVAYTLGLGEHAGDGRYLFLDPDLEKAHQVFEASKGDPDLEAAFRHALEAVLRAWDAGAFFPRLVAPGREGEPEACGYCGVRQACLRGDTGAEMRLEGWMQAFDPAALPSGTAREAAEAMAALWRLHETDAGEPAADEGGEP
ncbi:MAG: PD-(D/E)XK nuclease family protein, partial [Deltaproteobacteria bacterium]|nr:PD-(D/E)XK nuclease family protein [Deltaproteobacteria bacterium]